MTIVAVTATAVAGIVAVIMAVVRPLIFVARHRKEKKKKTEKKTTHKRPTKVCGLSCQNPQMDPQMDPQTERNRTMNSKKRWVQTTLHFERVQKTSDDIASTSATVANAEVKTLSLVKPHGPVLKRPGSPPVAALPKAPCTSSIQDQQQQQQRQEEQTLIKREPTVQPSPPSAFDMVLDHSHLSLWVRFPRCKNSGKRLRRSITTRIGRCVFNQHPGGCHYLVKTPQRGRAFSHSSIKNGHP